VQLFGLFLFPFLVCCLWIVVTAVLLVARRGLARARAAQPALCTATRGRLPPPPGRYASAERRPLGRSAAVERSADRLPARSPTRPTTREPWLRSVGRVNDDGRNHEKASP